MSTLLEYKCPNCGGAIGFDSEIQNMKCPFCDSEFEMEALKSYDDALKSDAEEKLQWEAYDENSGNGCWQEGEEDGLCSYSCESCGGQIVGETQIGATKCPYCDNPIVISAQFSGIFRPDFVVPFKLDKKAAKGNLKDFYKNKFLLPKSFQTENRIDNIIGLYVPFWLFTCKSNALIRYKATKKRLYSDSNFNYIETRHFLVTRGGNLDFQNIPVDGSVKMNDVAMESIEPFSYNELKDFQTAYLAGYIADKYDVDAEQAIPRANIRIKNTILDTLAPKEYDSYFAENTNITLGSECVRYALLPVWILNTKYKDALHTFVMNGQTGKFSGKLPICKVKLLSYFTGIFTSIVAASAIVIYLIL